MAERPEPGRRCIVPHLLPRDPSLLRPLLDHLAADRPAPPAGETFPRGALLSDGRLDLCKQNIGPEGARMVAEVVGASRQVTSIMLGADDIQDEGAEAIAEAVTEHPSIRTVYLGCNRISGRGAAHFARAFKANPQLHGLWIKRNPIGLEGAEALAALLREPSGLKTLDLVQTGIGEHGAALIIEALQHNTGLERLYLGGNGLSASFARTLTPLFQHPSLRELYLSANELSDEGATELAGALSEASSLEVLSLASNGLGQAGVMELAEALKRSTKLRNLDLGRANSTEILAVAANHIDDDAALALAEGVAESPSLKRLRVRGAGLSLKGAALLIEALEANPRIIGLEVDDLPGSLRRALRALLRSHRQNQPAFVRPAHIKAIQSIYRTAPQAQARQAKTKEESPDKAPKRRSEPAELPVTDAELESCRRVLEKLGERAELFLTKDRRLAPVRAEANRLIAAIKTQSRGRRGFGPLGEKRKAQSKQQDRAQIAATGLRRKRASQQPHSEPKALPEPAPEELKGPQEALSKSRRCYVCKARYRDLHHFYDQLCQSCGEDNFRRRDEPVDLEGRCALLTGGRIKIGFRAGLRLLRGGARLHITTRFPCDAAERYGAEADFAEWRERLHIHALDLRHLPGVLSFAEQLDRACPDGLDILMNNAAQTVRRPPAFYEHLIAAEQAGPAALAEPLRALVSDASGREALPGALSERLEQEPGRALVPALFSQIPLSEHDLTAAEAISSGLYDAHGQPLDKRALNSWVLRVGDIDPSELLEVHSVNAIAPFLLINRLLPTMRRSAFKERFIVNVSAMEGKFDYRQKQPEHPHTNMAKAALNMLTRTAGPGLIDEGIAMTSVDTGWITNEQPFEVCESMKEHHNFEPPLDEIDGAARILDPIIHGLKTGQPQHSCFLKDYRVVSW